MHFTLYLSILVLTKKQCCIYFRYQVHPIDYSNIIQTKRVSPNSGLIVPAISSQHMLLDQRAKEALGCYEDCEFEVSHQETKATVQHPAIPKENQILDLPVLVHLTIFFFWVITE